MLPDDGKRYELIQGDLYVSPARSTEHQKLVSRLLIALAGGLGDSAIVLVAPVDVIFEQTSVVQPDLVIVRAERKAIVTKRAIEGAPDIVIEIVSPGSEDRDRLLKRKLYERHGVLEYWIVDADYGFVDVLRLEDGVYRDAPKLDRASTLTTPLFPELAVTLEPLFQPL